MTTMSMMTAITMLDDIQWIIHDYVVSLALMTNVLNIPSCEHIEQYHINLHSNLICTYPHFLCKEYLVLDLVKRVANKFQNSNLCVFLDLSHEYFNKSPLKLHDEMKGRDIQTYILHLKLHNALGTFV